MASTTMSDIPKFTLYGDGEAAMEQSIQPTFGLRGWTALTKPEKEIAFRQLRNAGWLGKDKEILETVLYLNHRFLRACPGKNVHKAQGDDDDLRSAALEDFAEIFLNEKNEALVLLTLSKFAQQLIDTDYLRLVEDKQGKERTEYLDKAFWFFDRLRNCLNHIFEQFAVSQLVTRNSFVPRQDEKITEQLYKPTLAILSDPKWKTVSADLSEMFVDYREQRYPEVITKAHSAVQRFLQIQVGEEGKSGKGELSKLVSEAKRRNIIPTNRFIDPVVSAILGYIPSERANNSTAKPALKETTPAEAMLMMNVVMILLQFCLQNVTSAPG
jgi:hypothetical protein